MNQRSCDGQQTETKRESVVLNFKVFYFPRRRKIINFISKTGMVFPCRSSDVSVLTRKGKWRDKANEFYGKFFVWSS